MEKYRINPDNLDDLIEEMSFTARMTKANVSRYIKTAVPAEKVYHAIVQYVEKNEQMVVLPSKEDELHFKAVYQEA